MSRESSAQAAALWVTTNALPVPAHGRFSPRFSYRDVITERPSTTIGRQATSFTSSIVIGRDRGRCERRQSDRGGVDGWGSGDGRQTRVVQPASKLCFKKLGCSSPDSEEVGIGFLFLSSLRRRGRHARQTDRQTGARLRAAGERTSVATHLESGTPRRRSVASSGLRGARERVDRAVV